MKLLVSCGIVFVKYLCRFSDAIVCRACRTEEINNTWKKVWWVSTIFLKTRSTDLLMVHAKKCWVVSAQLWVKYGLTQLLRKKFNVKIYPNGWVSPYLTQSWVETTQHFLECNTLNFEFMLKIHLSALKWKLWLLSLQWKAYLHCLNRSIHRTENANSVNK